MTNTETLPAYTRLHWAKSDREKPHRIHLLEHHLADVGACLEKLLRQPTIRRRFAATAGMGDLDDATAARLAVFAALHDIGKVNAGFQTQIWREADLRRGRRPPSFRRVGHTLDLTPVLNGDDAETARWFFNALGWWDDILTWDDRCGETVCALFVAALSHHGRPLKLEGARQPNPKIWRPFGGLDPRKCVTRIGRLMREWFPVAFSSGAPPLPSAPAFQHHFLGLCNLADWIGSNEEWFPYFDTPRIDYIADARTKARHAVNAVRLDLAKQRSTFPGLPGFADLFDFQDPNAIQRASQDVPLDSRVVIIESETGSGKTEAALWKFAHMYEAGLVDGFYFALPTRAAAVQIHERVESFVANLFPRKAHRPPVVLAVPGYEADAAAANLQLPAYTVRYDEQDRHEQPWASERPKRYLAAQVAVGTVDQAMLGALQVKNAHMRTACLARNLLVVDEVHASDVYMGAVLEQLLAAHTAAGGYALLMSATLGSTARRRWLRLDRRAEGDDLPLAEAIDTFYPAVSVPDDAGGALTAVGENLQGKNVGIQATPAMNDFAALARRALEAARAGAKVLVVRNTVGHAIETQQALQKLVEPGDGGLLFAVNGVPTLHHGRFASIDRPLLDRRVEELLGKGREPGGCVVIGTQTLEQSLDIDADLLIADLCPVDVLLQRIGRLHRHRGNARPRGYAEPACIVLAPPDDDLAPLLKGGQNANGLGPHGHVYPSLHTLEATRRLIAQYPEWRIPEMNRELVERATHPEALEEITEEMGADWCEHANSTEGGHIADALTARGHTIKFDRSFFNENRGVLFANVDEELVRTRLGDDRIDVCFEPTPPSPFDPSSKIDRLAVPLRWLGGQDVPDKPVSPRPSDGGFEFSIEDRKFCYDRLGLRQVLGILSARSEKRMTPTSR